MSWLLETCLILTAYETVYQTVFFSDFEKVSRKENGVNAKLP